MRLIALPLAVILVGCLDTTDGSSPPTEGTGSSEWTLDTCYYCPPDGSRQSPCGGSSHSRVEGDMCHVSDFLGDYPCVAEGAACPSGEVPSD